MQLFLLILVGDCTGAKSLICNDNIQETYAKVRFFTEAELLEIVQQYLDGLESDIKLGSVQDIKNLPIATLVNHIGENNKKESYFNKLETYVNHFNDFSYSLGTEKTVQKNDIRRYVAQFLGDEAKTKVFNYLAVKEVEIHTKFIYSDAGKIMLVDTIGLGDTSIGLRDKMINTLVNDSDAAIILRRPDKLRDGIREADNDLYDVINQQMKGRDLEKWLFYVLNTYGENKATSDNLYSQLKRKLGKTLLASFVKQIDCADKDAVENELVVPMLRLLSENLDEIDDKIMELANNKLNDVFNEVYSLNAKLADLVNNSLLKSIEGSALFDDLYKTLKLNASLKKYNQQYIQRDKEDPVLKEAIISVIKNLKHWIPSKDDIIQCLNSGETGEDTEDVYHRYAHDIRSSIRDEFNSVCRMAICDMQKKLIEDIISLLRADDTGKLTNIQLSSEVYDGLDWLRVLIDEKLSDYEYVQKAFTSVLNYHIQIEGLLQFKVHCALDCYRPEDPENYPEGTLPSLGEEKIKKLTVDERAEVIRQTLSGQLPQFAESLRIGIQELLIIPNNSFNALVQKLRDRLFYKDKGRRDLKNFYRNNCVSIWHEEFAKINAQNEISQELKQFSSCLNEYIDRKRYIL